MPPGFVLKRKNRHALCKAKCSHALMAALNEIRSAIREPAWLRKLKANCQLDDFSSDLAMAERLGVWEELICSRTPSVWQEWRRAHEPLGLLDGCAGATGQHLATLFCIFYILQSSPGSAGIDGCVVREGVPFQTLARLQPAARALVWS